MADVLTCPLRAPYIDYRCMMEITAGKRDTVRKFMLKQWCPVESSDDVLDMLNQGHFNHFGFEFDENDLLN